MSSRPARAERDASAKIHWVARIERRFHGWRERMARRSGRSPQIVPFAGYGGEGWIRVVGRVLILPPIASRGADDGVRGWRSFLGIAVAYSTVTVTIGDAHHDIVADRGGVIDTVLPADLAPGWQTFQMSVEGGEPVEARVFVVDPAVRFGVICDVDDTVMVTALPRPLLAAWNSFVVNEHARQPVPGMAVLLERVVRSHPGAPMLYLSTGAWNVAPTLTRFLHRNLFPRGSMLLTDWGPTHDRWFRSGRDHKETNLRRLAEEFPQIEWLLIGDDGQHDDEIYTRFTAEYPSSVAGVAIRRLTATEAVLAGGRTSVDDHSAAGVPWVSSHDGAGLAKRLERVGLLD
ncbi:App1 family protein [Microbacterium sp. G2-8]|uniref:App1 family protein n=1 Tax=Microbacterium sp. G2-8 TaxID=2842454 RepID=UPI001C8B07E0|nr:phosphatase domain-containing protein [Microbacterium sp. G2-8]